MSGTNFVFFVSPFACHREFQIFVYLYFVYVFVLVFVFMVPSRDFEYFFEVNHLLSFSQWHNPFLWLKDNVLNFFIPIQRNLVVQYTYIYTHISIYL